MKRVRKAVTRKKAESRIKIFSALYLKRQARLLKIQILKLHQANLQRLEKRERE
jgi:hypothetical protein